MMCLGNIESLVALVDKYAAAIWGKPSAILMQCKIHVIFMGYQHT